MRTREQIVADCEAAFERLKEEAASKAIANPCAECEWGDSHKGAWCHHPLIKGFGLRVFVGDCEQYQRLNARLCGPEKALWEPRRNFLQRLFDWIARLFTPTSN